jgi:hypothetical protein
VLVIFCRFANAFCPGLLSGGSKSARFFLQICKRVLPRAAKEGVEKCLFFFELKIEQAFICVSILGKGQHKEEIYC